MTWTHGASAYRKGHCRCREICTPAHAKKRRHERATGAQRMNSGRTSALRLDGDTLYVNVNQKDILDSWLRDGADTETVARRTGLAVATVRRNLTEIRHVSGCDTQIELVVAFLRGYLDYRVDSPANDETSDSGETPDEKEERYGRYPTWPRAAAG